MEMFWYRNAPDFVPSCQTAAVPMLRSPLESSKSYSRPGVGLKGGHPVTVHTGEPCPHSSCSTLPVYPVYTSHTLTYFSVLLDDHHVLPVFSGGATDMAMDIAVLAALWPPIYLAHHIVNCFVDPKDILRTLSLRVIISL